MFSNSGMREKEEPTKGQRTDDEREKAFNRSSQLEREHMQRLEDMNTEGDDEGTVMLEGMCRMSK